MIEEQLILNDPPDSDQVGIIPHSNIFLQHQAERLNLVLHYVLYEAH